MKFYKHETSDTDLFVMPGEAPVWLFSHVDGSRSENARIPVYCRERINAAVILVHMVEWVYNGNLTEVNEEEARSLDSELVDRIARIECGEEMPQFTKHRDHAVLERVAEDEVDEDEEEQICCVCGKPAEGEDVCKCSCPSCGEDCFNDVTLADHGVCYDCHQKRLLRPAGEEDEEEAKSIIPTVDFEWDATFFGGNYSGSGDTTQVPISLIDQFGGKAAFEQFTSLARCHIVSWTPEESEAYGNEQTQEELDLEQRELQAFAQKHVQKCVYCAQLQAKGEIHRGNSE